MCSFIFGIISAISTSNFSVVIWSLLGRGPKELPEKTLLVPSKGWGVDSVWLPMKWVSDMVDVPLEEEGPASALLALPDEEGKVNMGQLSLSDAASGTLGDG